MSNFHDNNTNYSNYNGYPNNSNIPNEPSGGGNRNGRHSNAVVIVSIALVMLILGGLLFGVDLFLFNFFMPLVFAADIPDLILRTLTDTFAVTVGCLALPNSQKGACIDG